METTERRPVDIHGAALRLGVSQSTIKRITDLPRVRIGKRVLYPIDALDQWADARIERPDRERKTNAA